MKWIFFLLNVLLGHTLLAQDNTEVLSNLLKYQKKYITDSISVKERSKYFSLLHFANILHPRVKDEISKIDTTFWSDPVNIKILELFPSNNRIKGWFWKDTNLVFYYTYGAENKLMVDKSSLSQLQDSIKNVIQNFNNWNYSIFSTHGRALTSPTYHHFYLASKNILTAGETIGFYYPN